MHHLSFPVVMSIHSESYTAGIGVLQFKIPSYDTNVGMEVLYESGEFYELSLGTVQDLAKYVNIWHEQGDILSALSMRVYHPSSDVVFTVEERTDIEVLVHSDDNMKNHFGDHLARLGNSKYIYVINIDGGKTTIYLRPDHVGVLRKALDMPCFTPVRVYEPDNE